MIERNPITPEGHARLRDELNQLRTVERPRISQMIAEARAHGDLKENAEYHAARDKQSFVEGRIAEIEDRLARAEVIDPSTFSGNRVMFGAYVTVANEDGDEVTYRLVGADESDTDKGWIAVTSPIARSLIGKEVGDEVTVRTPGGAREVEILTVRYQ